MLNMILIISTMLAVTQSAISPYNISSCLYIQRFSCFTANTVKNYIAGGYSFTLSWLTAQPGIINSSYVFTDFNIKTPNVFLSYDAFLKDVASTTGVFVFNPSTKSEIVTYGFSVILLKSCTCIIQLQFVTFYPTIFAMPIRTANSEYASVSLITTFSSDLSSYQYDVFISSFILTQVSSYKQMELSLTAQPIMPGQNTQKITLYSGPIQGNIFTKITFTYILVNLASYNNRTSYYHNAFSNKWAPFSVSSNFGIPSIFNPYLSRKCIIAMQWLYSKSIANNPMKLTVIDAGTITNTNINSIQSTNMNAISIGLFCIQECIPDYIVNYTVSSFTCVYSPNAATNTTNSTFVLCQPNQFLLIVKDQCFNVCPKGYYGNEQNYICFNCLVDCITCVNGSRCQKCLFGWPVRGGCTDISGCLKVNSNLPYDQNRCLQCDSAMFTLSNGVCTCAPGFFIVTKVCTNVTGCIVARFSNNQSICLACNFAQRFVIIEGMCECMSGYQLTNGECLQICGDGLLFFAACDDGNKVDGDGCASNCTVQYNYECTKGISSRLSICAYTRLNVAISLQRIDKIPDINQGKFTFSLTPYIKNAVKLNLTKDVGFVCSQLISIAKIDLDKGQLVLYVNFFQDLEGNNAKMILQLESNYFVQRQVSLSFKMNSNGIKLYILKSQYHVYLCKDILIGLSISIMAIFFISLFFHKMVGIELIHTYQVIYLVHLANNEYTLPYSLLKYFAITTYDFLNGVNGFTSIHTVKQNVIFSSENMQFTQLIILGISFLFAVLFLIIQIAYKININQENSKTKKQDKILRWKRLVNTSYHQIVFPALMGILIVYWLIILQPTRKSTFFINNLLSALMIIISFAFFYEWKFIFIEISDQFSTNFGRSKPRYIPIYLAFILVVIIIISALTQNEGRFSLQILAGLYIVFLVLMIFYKPYKWRIHNIGVFVNLSAVCYFMVWSAIKSNHLVTYSEENQISILGVLIILLILSPTISIIRIVFEIHSKCKKKSNPKQNNQKSNQCRQIIDQEYEYMKQIYKNNLNNRGQADQTFSVRFKAQAITNLKRIKSMRQKLKKKVIQNSDNLDVGLV